MSTLRELRVSLTEDQRRILNEVRVYELEKDTLIPTSALYHRLGKDAAASAVSSLNGSLVREYPGSGTPRCGLTFLGRLLAEGGDEGEALITKVLGHVRDSLRADPEFSEISSESLKESFSLSDDQIRSLWQHLFHSPFSGGGGGGSPSGWKFGISYHMRNDLPLEDEVAAYLERHALKDYDPDLPVLHEEREAYLSGKNTGAARGVFWFVKDTDLRELLEADWREARRVHEAKAWKSCVILCGGILEGILMDALDKDWANASREYSVRRRRPAPPLNEWDLVDLVESANKLRTFPKGAIHLSHAVREFRNLIHPGKQIRENVRVTEEQANVAINAVRMCIPS
jgi:hypothetical protein